MGGSSWSGFVLPSSLHLSRGDWHGLVLFQAVFLTEPSKYPLPKGQQDTLGLGKEVVGSGGCPGPQEEQDSLGDP